MATRFAYIVTDKDFSILTLCFICLLQSLDFLCFLCLSPDVVLQRDTKWLFVLWQMWTTESLLSKGHIRHNTGKPKACKMASGVLWVFV